MPGPPKTPTHLQLVRGNPSKRAVNKNEPKPPSGVPPTPKHFSKQEKYWFKRMGDELDLVGVITKLDGLALEQMIAAYIEWRTHRDLLEVEGWVYTTTSQTGDKMIKANPRVGFMDNARKFLNNMMQQFGLTPASRSKVNTGSAGDADPFDEFLKARE